MAPPFFNGWEPSKYFEIQMRDRHFLKKEDS